LGGARARVQVLLYLQTSPLCTLLVTTLNFVAAACQPFGLDARYIIN
jgi:hypothetical protein